MRTDNGANRNYKEDGSIFDRKILDIKIKGNERLFRTWKTTLYKCASKNHISYKYYGGKGISVCEEWLTFSNFVNWSNNNGYTDKLTLDRIDNSKDYNPDNCRWVTWKVQENNRSNNVLIEIDGVTKNLYEWSEISNISKEELTYRYNKQVPSDEFLNKDFDVKRFIKLKSNKTITHNGITKTIKEWSIFLNCSEQTLYHRLKAGIPNEELFNFKTKPRKK